MRAVMLTVFGRLHAAHAYISYFNTVRLFFFVLLLLLSPFPFL